MRRRKIREEGDKMRRCYFITDDDLNEGFAIVATTGREAKKLAWRNCGFRGDWDFIDMRVRLRREVKVDDLEIGTELNSMEGLRRGAYDYVTDEECPKCKRVATLSLINEEMMCGNCEDKEEEKKECETKER